MGLFNNWQLLIIRLLCCLGWFSTFAFAQSDISEGVSGMLNFPTLGVTCLGNLSVFITSLIRGRLDTEIGARDALDILASPKLKNINGIQYGNGLTTCTEEKATLTISTEERLQTASTASNIQPAAESLRLCRPDARATPPSHIHASSRTLCAVGPTRFHEALYSMCSGPNTLS